MQKLLAFALVAALVTPTLATAAVPGTNLGWSNCGTTATTQNRVFACDANDATFNLVASWRLAADLTDYAGLSAVVDYRVNDPGVPAWWSFGPGGCREGSLGLVNVGTVGFCTNPYVGGNQGGGFQIEDTPTLPGANDFRVRILWARDSPFSATANTLYSGFVLQMNSSGTVDEGAGVCAGCTAAACLVLNVMEVFGFNSGSAAKMEQADVRNWATWQGGDVGTDICPNGTPTQNRTWGQIKSLYR